MSGSCSPRAGWAAEAQSWRGSVSGVWRGARQSRAEARGRGLGHRPPQGRPGVPFRLRHVLGRSAAVRVPHAVPTWPAALKRAPARPSGSLRASSFQPSILLRLSLAFRGGLALRLPPVCLVGRFGRACWLCLLGWSEPRAVGSSPELALRSPLFCRPPALSAVPLSELVVSCPSQSRPLSRGLPAPAGTVLASCGSFFL